MPATPAFPGHHRVDEAIRRVDTVLLLEGTQSSVKDRMAVPVIKEGGKCLTSNVSATVQAHVCCVVVLPRQCCTANCAFHLAARFELAACTASGTRSRCRPSKPFTFRCFTANSCRVAAEWQSVQQLERIQHLRLQLIQPGSDSSDAAPLHMAHAQPTQPIELLQSQLPSVPDPSPSPVVLIIPE